MEKINNITLEFLNLKDYQSLKETMDRVYKPLPDPAWKHDEIKHLLELFPAGQVVLKVNGELAGCALSIIVPEELASKNHSYKEITGNYSFNTHSPNGQILYGIDIFIKPEYRGLRLGRRLYDYRKDLCEDLNLKGIIFGGRIPNYHTYADKMSPKEYLKRVQNKEIHDPVLDFQLSNDFRPIRVLKNYLDGDKTSND
ncbi:MAG TPA: GNAT family N-acetyltransferase, partial [Chitinophagaceae bacterium]|nr:GNAT family N-acetyltransferase [Chitinophagaceae bacterium]